ncbi:MAG: serine/threonine protein kinase [Candidatus Obscuribacter sp.]|nr:serine/threonine protein kinase [Candidatus Obscuribacter sp.]
MSNVFFVTSFSAGLVAIYFLASPWGATYLASHGLPPLALLVACALFATWLILALASRFINESILVSRDGITLPMILHYLNGVGTWHGWAEVGGATIGNQEHESERSLDLQLRIGRTVSIPIASMERQDLEQLLLSIELWGINCKRSPELIEFQNNLYSSGNDASGLSYTTMWNDELGRRFSSTTFVPHEPDTILQDGRITVVKQLAFGGLSAIYLVQDRHKELRVLKEAVVPASMELNNRDAAELALKREVAILSQLQHKNIVRVTDHFVEGEHHYMLLEHVAGQDLRQLVRQKGPQSQSSVLDWAIQIAQALEYLHHWQPPIMHRDLTPENIVLKNDGTIVIIDFGASNQFLGTMTGTIIGKQSYMAPEQYQGKANCQSDVYSFGATLHFLLTGKDPVPLTESSPALYGEAIQVSAALDAVVNRCTSLDLAERFGTISEVKERLMEIYTSQGIASLFSEAQ